MTECYPEKTKWCSVEQDRWSAREKMSSVSSIRLDTLLYRNFTCLFIC